MLRSLPTTAALHLACRAVQSLTAKIRLEPSSHHSEITARSAKRAGKRIERISHANPASLRPPAAGPMIVKAFFLT